MAEIPSVLLGAVKIAISENGLARVQTTFLEKIHIDGVEH